MHIGNSHTHENFKDNEATLDIYDILGKGERWGDRVLDFRSEKGQLTSS